MQQELHGLKNKYAQGGSLESAYPKHMGAKSVYLAGGWWGQGEPIQVMTIEQEKIAVLNAVMRRV